MIACSRMYNVTPRVSAAWQTLFDWVCERSGIPLDVIEYPAPAPLEELWARSDIGCVFMCGWPFAAAAPQPRIVCAPIPAPPRYGGRPIYVTDFVTRADRNFGTLEDTFGGRLAWTVDHSHSGYNAPRHHLQRYRSDERPRLYSDSAGPLVSPGDVIAAVLSGQADVGPVDGWYLDILKHDDPAAVAELTVVATTQPSPIPPLVAQPEISAADLRRLQKAFRDAPEQRSLSSCFETLLIKAFAFPEAGDYEQTLLWAQSAIDAGYAVPG